MTPLEKGSDRMQTCCSALKALLCRGQHHVRIKVVGNPSTDQEEPVLQRNPDYEGQVLPLNTSFESSDTHRSSMTLTTAWVASGTVGIF